MHKLMRQSVLQETVLVSVRTRCCLRERSAEVEKDVEKKGVQHLKKYWFNRYVNYIKNYELVLEKNFPRTMRVYRVFSVGTKEFYYDLKKYVGLTKKKAMLGIDSFTREELQLTYTVRRDLIKISPVLLISAIPFTNYIIYPLAYYFPRYLLTAHYWTLQQRLEFMLLDHKKRLKHNRPLFRCMQAELHTIEDQLLKTKWNSVIACLGSGTHPYTKDILACSKLFMEKPYALQNLKRKHIKELLAIHGLSQWRPFKRRRLMERGMLIKRMDVAIQREGGVSAMSNDALRWALSFRGVNPTNMSQESMKEWLEQWLTVSTHINESSISLLLHCPILLAYNHSTNWILIYN